MIILMSIPSPVIVDFLVGVPSVAVSALFHVLVVSLPPHQVLVLSHLLAREQDADTYLGRLLHPLVPLLCYGRSAVAEPRCQAKYAVYDWWKDPASCICSCIVRVVVECLVCVFQCCGASCRVCLRVRVCVHMSCCEPAASSGFCPPFDVRRAAGFGHPLHGVRRGF